MATAIITLMRMNTDSKIPPKPEKPLPEECCGGGCIPCILELYEEELARWKAEVDSIRKDDDKQK